MNGGTVAPTGASNINHIVIKGTTTEDGGETTETCAEVEASVEPGKVAAGTEVTLSCQTEGAEIYYKVNDAQEFTKYDAAITITENTTITAYSQKEGFNNSEQKVFSYTVEEEPAPEPEPDPSEGQRLTELKDGDVFVMYNPANKKVNVSFRKWNKAGSIGWTTIGRRCFRCTGRLSSFESIIR